MKNKILFALAILLVLSSIWAVGDNNTLLDSDAFISCTKLERIYN